MDDILRERKVVVRIMVFLDVGQITRCEQVCPNFKKTLQQSAILWKTIYSLLWARSGGLEYDHSGESLDTVRIVMTNSRLEYKKYDWRNLCLQKYYNYHPDGPLLRIPDVPELNNVEYCFENTQIVQSVQTVVEEWIHLILIVLEDLKGVDAFTRDIPPEELPLAEARFWKARFHNIKGLFQQLSKDEVESMVTILKLAEAGPWKHLTKVVSTVKQLHTEAMWNWKYFKILEKPFQILATSDIPQEPLLVRIGKAVTARVSQSIRVWELLSSPNFAESKATVDAASRLLGRWRTVYSPGDIAQRWGPFSEDKLFNQVDYVAQRCCELREIIGLLDYVNEDMSNQLDGIGSSDIQNDEEREQVADLRKRSDLLIIELEEQMCNIKSAKEAVRMKMRHSVDVFDPTIAKIWSAAVQRLRNEVSDMMNISHSLATNIDRRSRKK